MKARKILPQQQLLSECVEQLQSTFKPELKAIKSRIQDLISMEYLERDNENSNLLRYSLISLIEMQVKNKSEMQLMINFVLF